MEGHLSRETLLAILILLFYTISAPLFKKYHFHSLHESGICMIVGLLISFVASAISPEHNFTKTLKFDDEIFFTFILPPIIFSAGYNINRRLFFKYLMYILIFAIGGTVLAFCIIAPLTFLANQANLFHRSTHPRKLELLLGSNTTNTTIPTVPTVPVNTNTESKHRQLNDNTITYESYKTILDQNLYENLNLRYLEVEETTTTHNLSNSEKNKLQTNTTNANSTNNTLINEEDIDDTLIKFSVAEILLFSAVISATDTVAALTFVDESEEAKLYSILFGEGVINDAVCIVLYKIIKDFTDTGEEFTPSTPFSMLGSFMNLFVLSTLVGIFVGIFSALFLKKLKEINLNRVQETSCIIFFAFISYTLAEEFNLSPIIALLMTGISMSQYTFFNLSFQARDESSIVSKIMANIAEAFVFTYLGLTVIYYLSISFSFSFICIELIIVTFARFCSTVGLSYVIRY